MPNQESVQQDIDNSELDDSIRGVSDLWHCVNHVALVVSDVGRSLNFYTDVVGMKQVMRPNFDRHGAWLTMGNVDLHLIKGRPAVHPDDDLIVSHIAITISDMAQLKKRLGKMQVKSRKNVSVPNPSDSETGIVDQAFVRDPDGYYIEFCNCESLESYLHHKMAENEKILDLGQMKSVLKASNNLKAIAGKSKKILSEVKCSPCDWNLQLQLTEQHEGIQADPIKLANLIKRKNVYGDITQNASDEELRLLLIIHDNHVPAVILALEDRVRAKGTRTYIPPAFYGRDGNLVQPPSFEMPMITQSSTIIHDY